MKMSNFLVSTAANPTIFGQLKKLIKNNGDLLLIVAQPYLPCNNRHTGDTCEVAHAQLPRLQQRM